MISVARGAEPAKRRPEQAKNPPVPAVAAQTATPTAPEYVIGPADVLAVNVWKDAEISRSVTVRPDGKISLPLVGEIGVSGLTAVAVRDLVTAKLKPFITDPHVTVIVEQVKSRTYSVLGKVSKPGSYVLDKPTTVLDAIAIAGGFLDFAKINKIYIMRRMGSSSMALNFDYREVIRGRKLEQNVDLANGDTIVVP